MFDMRMKIMAQRLLSYSLDLKAGDKLVIKYSDIDYQFVNELIKGAFEIGAHPYVKIVDSRVNRELLRGLNEMWVNGVIDCDRNLMTCDAYINIDGNRNAYETSDVSGEKMQLYSRNYRREILDPIVKNSRWLVLSYPTPSSAQAAGMSTEAFEDFYFNVCCVDYAKMSKAMDALTARLKRTDKVRITGPGTDLSFSIKGIPSVKCDGRNNIPDGEIFTAPVKNSINGVIQYNAPSNYNGFRFENVRFVFKDGKIIEESGNNNQKISDILNTDEGARYIGEFAFGLNPGITEPTGDILFDEKISGSIHLTPGKAYDDAFNGNYSSEHWDLVLIQTPKYGGGEIFFDGELIRKDGLFIDSGLLPLNPENLK